MPVRARLVGAAKDWRWSSVGDFAAFLGEPFDEAAPYSDLREAEAATQGFRPRIEHYQ